MNSFTGRSQPTLVALGNGRGEAARGAATLTARGGRQGWCFARVPEPRARRTPLLSIDRGEQLFHDTSRRRAERLVQADRLRKFLPDEFVAPRQFAVICKRPAWRLLPRNAGRLHQLEVGGDVVLEEPVEFRNGHRQLLDTIFANRSCTDGNTSAFTTSSCSLSTMARLGSTLRYRKDRSH